MWFIFCFLLVFWLSTSIVLNVTRICDYIQMQRASIQLQDIYTRFEQEHIGECDKSGKHAKED